MVTIVIPNKIGESPEITINSLCSQTLQCFDIIVVNNRNNANQARNRGLAMVKTRYVLFSDNDILWEPGAILHLYNAIELYDLPYVYGSYQMGGRRYCDQEWDAKLLTKKNYISTMSLVRTHLHPGFDPQIKRLQDWDVWLTMLAQGHEGHYIRRKIFDTNIRNGITFGSVTWEEAVMAIKEKHGI